MPSSSSFRAVTRPDRCVAPAARFLVRVDDLLGLPVAEPGDGQQQRGQGEGEPAPAERPRGGGQRLCGRPGRLQGQRPLPHGDGQPVDEPGGGERGGHEERERGRFAERRREAAVHGEPRQRGREPREREPRLPPHPVQGQHQHDGCPEAQPVGGARVGGRAGGDGSRLHVPDQRGDQRQQRPQRVCPPGGRGGEPALGVGSPPVGGAGRYVFGGQWHRLSGHPRIMANHARCPDGWDPPGGSCVSPGVRCRRARGAGRPRVRDCIERVVQNNWLTCNC